MSGIQVGQPVPAWSARGYLPNGDFAQVKSSDYKGKWVVVFFYPLDFTFVCPTEIQAFGQSYAEFKQLNAEVFAVSTDSVYSHKAWAQGSLGQQPFIMLEDTNHELSKLFGVLMEGKGIALRGTFIISPEGVLVSATINHLAVGRSVDETLRVLQAFQKGELMPCGWKPGMKTLGKA
jgi:alkyl hydroperoxide reductase subunit AhpC